MKDIVPELYEQIKADFDVRIRRDHDIQKMLSSETETSYSRLTEAAKRIGTYAVEALKKNLTEEKLPDGTLYWNIAKRTIEPLMQEAHTIVCALFAIIQKNNDTKAGIGLEPLIPDFNQERMNAILNKLDWLRKEDEA